MKLLARILFISVALFFQVTVLQIGSVWGHRPDLLLIVLTWLVLSTGTTLAFGYGFLLGFLQDIFSGGPIGLNALAKMGIGFFDSVLSKNIIVDNPVNRMVVVVANTFIQALLIGGIVSLLRSPVSVGDVVDLTLFYRMFLHGILSLPIMWAMDRIG